MVLGKKGIKNCAGLRSVLREYVPLANVLGPLSARERWPVERHVADEVERVEVLPNLVGQRLQRQSLARELVDDDLLPLCPFPLPEKGIETDKVLS